MIDNLHDNIIEKYEVDLVNNMIKIYTINSLDKKKSNLIFTEVLAHYFEIEISGSTILEISETSISTFIDKNHSLLASRINYCWPMDYNSFEELEVMLSNNNYKCYDIYASYGLNGFILAKKVQIDVL